MGHGGRGNVYSHNNQESAVIMISEQRVDLGVRKGSRSCINDYIEHKISKLDTLAGIAIKYGVEVADIKRLNGLTTDFQMFARRSLRIPLPGRHPPSEKLHDIPESSGQSSSDHQPRLGKHSYCALKSSLGDINDDKQALSSAMSLLRGYYGLASTQSDAAEGTEMEVYRAENGYQSEEEPFTPKSTSSSKSTDLFKEVLKKQAFSENSNRNSSSNICGNCSSSGSSGSGNICGNCSSSGSSSSSNICGNSSSSSSNTSTISSKMSEAQHPTAPNTFNSMVTKARDFVVGEVEKVKERAVRRRAKCDGPVDDSIKMDTGSTDKFLFTSNRNPVPRPKQLSPRMGVEVEVDCPTVRALVFNSNRCSSEASIFGSNGKSLAGSLLSGTVVEELIFKLKKSPSTPILQEEKPLLNNGSSIHKSSSKGDLAILSSNQSTSIPLLDTLTRRTTSKAALD